MKNQSTNAINGVLVINKPAGMTSFDVIAKLRKKYHQKKFGHTGTLDPMASGVLVVLAGGATKILPYLPDTNKRYIASIALGANYDTDDITGTIVEQKPIHRDFDFEDVLQSFQGQQHQKVPKASAKKVNGQKLYERLRHAQEVPDVYNDIEIYDIHALDEDDLSFEVACSSGTYIRSICRDFGEKTGNAAAMKSLVRIQACGFDLEQAQDLEAPIHTVYPIDQLLDYPKIQAPNPLDIRNGKAVKLEGQKADRVLMMEGQNVLAVYSRQKPGSPWYSCTRGLWYD